ncbi:nucleotide-binding oligomerization domain-containing protein 2-like [Oncorhynchus clarkii lewisi]|uniref:nucleotide-binding oligomerization domain-containing protein 2-like n=1 Tax=Oncorhynchus clarkii lewisi TaxID=490388 RepID=UPI0039B8CC58
MSARQLVLRQRAELLHALCCGGSSEGLESVLDLLLSWGMLFWEDYQNVRVPGCALCADTRVLLDLVYTKGDETCLLLLVAFKQLLSCLIATTPVRERRRLKVMHPPIHNPTKPVRRLIDRIEGALEFLLNTGSFTPSDCDEVQLLVFTPSQQVTNRTLRPV